MTRKEYSDLLKTIRGIYPDFKGYDDLQNYKYEEVYKNFALHKGTETPTYDELVVGLKHENEKDVWMQCDICREKIHYTTWDEFDKHYRKCQKIDFIDKQSKKIRNAGISKDKYYSMTDEELENNYRKVMDYYLQNRKETNFLKEI